MNLIAVISEEREMASEIKLVYYYETESLLSRKSKSYQLADISSTIEIFINGMLPLYTDAEYFSEKDRSCAVYQTISSLLEAHRDKVAAEKNDRRWRAGKVKAEEKRVGKKRKEIWRKRFSWLW